MGDAEDLLADICNWSPWVPFMQAVANAPRLPGVYLAREGSSGPVIYVGMAGERRGSHDRPQGIRGRLSVYARGKALASGLGEAVLDRALADVTWLRDRTIEVERGEVRRATDWGKAAFERSDLYIAWSVTSDPDAARSLEKRCLVVLKSTDLWNRLR